MISLCMPLLVVGGSTESIIRFVLLIVLVFCLALLGGQTLHAGTTSKNVPFKGSWIVVHPPSSPRPAETEQIEGNEVLELNTPAGTNSVLISPKLSLAGFDKLSFHLWSRQHSIVAVALQDSDNATFHAPIPVEANAWKQVVLTPTDFVLNDDSPVKKTSLDPKKIVAPLRVLDLGKLVGNQQPNLVKLLAMQVEYGGVVSSGNIDVPATINGGIVTITKSGTITHPVAITNGGKLIIKANSVHVTGNISLNRGTFELDGSSLFVDNKFPHQVHFILNNNSRLDLHGCSFSSPYMTHMEVFDSQVSIRDCVFHSNGFTMSPERSTMVLDNARAPGEMVVQSGCRYQVSNCQALLLWLRTGEKQKVDIALPDTTQTPLKNFTLPKETGLDIKITDSRMIMWALITIPGADVTIRNADVSGVGMAFPEPGPIKVSHLVDDAPIKSNPIDVADRRLSFINSKVRAFNFYPTMGAHLQIADCTFGEVNGGRNSDFLAQNSTCDGSGGYVRFSDQSTGHLVNCTLNCPVVAADSARLTMEHCTVNGPTSASDRAVITIKDCKLNGLRQEIGGGKIQSN
jgi:hypothetical protein